MAGNDAKIAGAVPDLYEQFMVPMLFEPYGGAGCRTSPRLGVGDGGRIMADLRAAGFTDITVEVVTRQSQAPDAKHAAVAVCQGTPLRMEIVARDADSLDRVTDLVGAHLIQSFGTGPIVAKTKALVVVAKA